MQIQYARAAFDKMLSQYVNDSTLVWDRSLVTPLQNDTRRMPKQSCYLLDLPGSGTYRDGVF
jgi:hypothetical protein